MLSGIVSEATGELDAQFPTLRPERIRRCVGETADQLRGSVSIGSLPEMLVRLARIRLITQLLDGDQEAVERITRVTAPDGLSRAVLEIARTHLDCAATALVLRDAAECVCAGVDSDEQAADDDGMTAPSAGQRFALAGSLPGRVMLRQEPVVLDDVQHERRMPQAGDGSTRVRSLAIVPVIGVDGAVAALGAYWPRPRAADAVAVAWLRRLASVTAAELFELAIATS